MLNEKRAHEDLDQRSRLPELRDIIVKKSGIRKLDIRTKYSWTCGKRSGIDAIPRLMNLHPQASDRLPHLLELRFSDPEPYEFDLDHVKQWSQCMD